MSRALYKILVDDLLQKIASGTIPVGERFPPEAEYAETLGVSRATLRQAFSLLEQNGILKRRQRGGTEVIAKRPIPRFDMVANSHEDVLSIARDTLLVVTAINEAPCGSIEELAEHDANTDSWLVYSASRYMAGQSDPFGVVEIYIPKQFSDIALDVGDCANSMLEKLKERYRVTPGKVTREISADVCADEVSAKLGLETGDAVLTILTEISSATGELLEIAHTIIDPARFSISADVVVNDEFG